MTNSLSSTSSPVRIHGSLLGLVLPTSLLHINSEVLVTHLRLSQVPISPPTKLRVDHQISYTMPEELGLLLPSQAETRLLRKAFGALITLSSVTEMLH